MSEKPRTDSTWWLREEIPMINIRKLLTVLPRVKGAP